ncbi:hypothetical protein CYMTET_35263 [Cymbomonas tetramitiformis]|uniref:Uncharacterized protein n=1 Tax=Cymbomonas tetramitiformis TaxID=36881 RepID=A0AAE0KP53_9CHLO|nr:hypothetical protein CYMTET_35263 [Cymbomonas tetramitiformis]
MGRLQQKVDIYMNTHTSGSPDGKAGYARLSRPRSAHPFSRSINHGLHPDGRPSSARDRSPTSSRSSSRASTPRNSSPPTSYGGGGMSTSAPVTPGRLRPQSAKERRDYNKWQSDAAGWHQSGDIDGQGRARWLGIAENPEGGVNASMRASSADVDRMAFSPEGGQRGGFLEELLGGAVSGSVSELSSKVENLVVESADLLQRRADLEWSASALGKMVRDQMMPKEWGDKFRDGNGADTEWIDALLADERSLNSLCACVLYSNFRLQSASNLHVVA